MVTQIIFKADKDLKDEAMKKAQSEGVTLKAVLYHALKLYIEGKLSFGLQVSEPEIEILDVSPAVQKKMDKIGDVLGKI